MQINGSWLRGVGVGMLITSGILGVSYMDLQDAIIAEREAAEYATRLESAYHTKAIECGKKRTFAAMDKDGKFVCADQAPAWAMNYPVKP